MTDISCRFCRSAQGEVVLDLGHQPAADHFPPADDPGPDPTYPLRMWLCGDCGLAQLAEDPTKPDEPRGVEPAALVAQARDAIGRASDAGFLPEGAVIAEYGSPHGGNWLDLLRERGLRIAEPGEQVDVLLDNIGMMHDADQAAGLAERIARLRPDGVLLMQFHSLAAIVAGEQWNALRHGHYAYYSVPALTTMLRRVGLKAVTAFWFELYGGTVLLAARRGGETDDTVTTLAERELAVGVQKADAVRGLQRAAELQTVRLASWLTEQHAAGKRVYGYSGASRAVALLARAGVGPALLPAVADASPAKDGRRMPGSGIPLISPAALAAAKPDAVVLFVADLLPEVRRALPEIEAAGGRWVVAGEESTRNERGDESGAEPPARWRFGG